MKKNFVLRSLLAIMLLFVGLNTAWADEMTLSYSDVVGEGTSGSGSEITYVASPITITFDKAYGNSGHVKAYAGCSITISGATISNVVINATTSTYIKSWSDASERALTISGSTATWTGSSNSVVLTNTASGQARITSIVVTYTAGGGDTPEPVDVAEPTFTPVDGTTFDESLEVTINVEDGLTAYYSFVENGEYTSGNTVNITETTTVYAYAQDTEGNKSDVVSATYTKNVPSTPGSTIIDVLTADKFAATSTKYTDFSNVSVTSDAVYAGNNSKTSGGAIQLRSKNSNSGIVTTKSGGRVKSITIKVESGSNTLDIYGKNSAYSSAADLYDSDAQGTKLGSLNADGTLTITGDYEYIGLRSNNGALYLTSITIEWETVATDPDKIEAPTFDIASGETVKMGDVVTITSAEGTTLWYTVGEEEYNVDTNIAEVTIPTTENKTVTIEAAAVSGDDMSEVATVTYNIAKLANPTVNVQGAVVANTEVTISAEEGATLVYTLNNNVDLLEAVAPLVVTITEETVIEVYATKVGYLDSEVETFSYTIKELVAPGSTIADVLTADKFAATSTKYTDFSNVSVTSDAVYAGNNSMAIDKDNAIQLRSTDQAGIVTTVSGGKVKKVTVTWNSNTNAERVMNVYGKNTPYTSAADLYASDENTKGVLIGSIAYGTTELVIKGDYEYIGLRSKSGAMYLDEIQIEWYKPYPENIVCEQNYYLDVEGSDWTIAEGNSLAACFVNKNTDATTWSVGEYLADTKHYVFYLSQYNVPAAAPARAKAEEAPVYTHVKFVNFEGATDALTPWVDGTRVNETAELTYTPAEGYDYTIYSVAGGAWDGKNDGISTGLEAVESDGMVYAGNVVAAEGAIEVYNLSGAVVARGNNRVDLNGLAGGVYVVRCGNDVLKVVR